MAYSEEARRRRKCTGTTAAGKPCNAWALWDDPRQLCVNHAGRHRRGKYGGPRKSTQTHRKPCTCPAYAWPHRPGGGLCRWPAPPLYRCSIPASTHSLPRMPRAVSAMIRAWKAAGIVD